VTDLVSERLILRPWDASEVKAVVEGSRHPSWAADFPAEGDGVIAGLMDSNPS
jgi:ribosomal-protein-alanine N-acetyltransferase